MNHETFFENFELLIDAPNSVEELRELILQLAVKGKLVLQDPNEEAASVLLEKIIADKERLIKEKKFRKSQTLPEIEKDEIHFDIPKTWKWIRLNDIGDWGAGSTPDRKRPEYYEGSILWFKSGELNDGYIYDSGEKITEDAFEDCSLRLNKPGDVLIAMYGATIGKVAILEVEATTNQAVCACTCFSGIYNCYLFYLLKAYRRNFSNQGAGGAQPNISRQKIIHTVAPLPPYEEQKRIVAKVDQLMALCDQLEARQQKKHEQRILLNNAALDKLLTAPTPGEFAQHWQRICDNFDLLYDAPETVGQLRQAILQLAVQGKLVAQDEGDEPAAVLIEKITSGKERLIKEGKIRKPKPLSSNEVENPYKLPLNWKWTRLFDIGLINPRNEAKDDMAASFIPMTLISETYSIPISSERRLWGEIKSGFTHFAEEDVVLAKITPCFQNGKSAVMRNLLNGFGAGTTELHVFRPLLDESVNPDYVLLYLRSPQFLKEGIERMTGTAGQKRVPRDYFAGNPFPLPPFEEQKRIVAKVEHLMALCDELEARLVQAQTEGGTLMEAVVHHVLAA